jgi:hypothetical protein
MLTRRLLPALHLPVAISRASVGCTYHHQPTLLTSSIRYCADTNNQLGNVRDSLLLLIPHDAFTAVAEVYAGLAAEERTFIRKSQHKQLGRLLTSLPDDFELTADKLQVRRKGSNDRAGTVIVPNAAGVAGIVTPHQHQQSPVHSTHATPESKPGQRKAVVAMSRGSRPKQKGADNHPGAPRQSIVDYVPVHVEPADPNLAPPPPPPGGNAMPSSHGSGNADTSLDDMIRLAKNPQAVAADPTAGCTLTTQQVAAYIPTYFVPMQEVVATMPEGYTVEHIESLFATTSTIQIVSVLDAKFVRLVGGFRNHCHVNLVDDEAAAQVRASFAAYMPDPDLMEPFLPMLEPRGEWRALFGVVTGIPDKEHAAKLPYHGPQSLLYFAQMQHIVAFSAANGGGLCVPMSSIFNLGWETSPVPYSCHATWKALEGNPTELQALWQVLPEMAREELLKFFGPVSVSARQATMVGLAKHRGWTAFAGGTVIPPPAQDVEPLPEHDAAANQGAEDEVDDTPMPLQRAPVSATRGWASATAADATDAVPQEETHQTVEEPLGATAPVHPQADAADAGDAEEEPPEATDAVRAREADEEAAEMRRRARELEDSEGHDEATDVTAAAPSPPSLGTESAASAAASVGSNVTADAHPTNSGTQSRVADDDDDDDVDDGFAAKPATTSAEADRDDTPEEETLRRFINCHGELFALRPSSRLALLAFEVKAYERQSLTLEEQLNFALERRNNTMARKIKRKMAVLANPDNPLLDEVNLAKAIADFLPPDRGLPWRALKNVLPTEVQDLIPIKRGKKFFEAYPELFKVYEIYHAGRKVIQRGHLPPPDGNLRGEGAYTEAEMLRVVANELTRRPRSVSGLVMRLPSGIERTMTKQLGGVAQFCLKYPQYFAVVLKDMKNKDLRTAMVTLLSMPPIDPEAEASLPQPYVSSTEKGEDDEWGGGHADAARGAEPTHGDDLL